MKIIGGSLKGHKIKVNKSIDFRPALSIVKEAVFDILQFKIESDDFFLDLFGGTGGIGLEAYSRGINHVFINEGNKLNFASIKENVQNFGIEEAVQVFNKDFRNMLDYCLNNNLVFNFIYVAPPYKDIDFYKYILKFIEQHPEILAEKALIFMEYRAKTELDFSSFTIYKDKKYGSTKLTILKKDK